MPRSALHIKSFRHKSTILLMYNCKLRCCRTDPRCFVSLVHYRLPPANFTIYRTQFSNFNCMPSNPLNSNSNHKLTANLRIASTKSDNSFPSVHFSTNTTEQDQKVCCERRYFIRITKVYSFFLNWIFEYSLVLTSTILSVADGVTKAVTHTSATYNKNTWKIKSETATSNNLRFHLPQFYFYFQNQVIQKKIAGFVYNMKGFTQVVLLYTTGICSNAQIPEHNLSVLGRSMLTFLRLIPPMKRLSAGLNSTRSPCKMHPQVNIRFTIFGGDGHQSV